MRAHVRACDVNLRQSLCLDVNHALLVLERAFDEEKAAACSIHAVLFKHVGCQNYIRDSRFVLHGEKHESLRRSWPLQRNYATDNANILAVRAVSKAIGCERSLSF